MALKTWTLAANPGLNERGQALLTDAPIAYQNGSALTESVLSMRQGFAPAIIFAGVDGPVKWVGEFLTNAGVRELWAVTVDSLGAAVLRRRQSSTWSTVSFSDTVNAGTVPYMQGRSFNGKFFLAYDSNVNRLHVWDGTSVRRVGLVAATAPTAAAMGAGAVSWTRWFRQRNARVVAGVTTMLSEPSTAVSITIAAKLGATITKGAVSGDSETYWVTEVAALEAGPWYMVDASMQVIGTATYDYTAATIDTASPSDELGSYVPPPSAKYLSTDSESLLMGGAWELTAATGQTTPKANRVWFTPPLGASDISDDERIPDMRLQKNWKDIGDAGPVTALSGPVYNDTIVLKNHTVAKLTPTGDVEAPYALTVISLEIGCVDQRLCTVGELQGIPAVLFADTNAIYALTSGGISNIGEAIGRDLRTATITDTGLLLFDSVQRVGLLQISSQTAGQAGSYRSFTFDSVKKQWSGFELGGATASGASWILNTSLLGTNTYLGGAGTVIYSGVMANTPDGQRRLHVGGVDANTFAVITTWGGQCGYDGTYAAFLGSRGIYTTSARFRKILALGSNATVGVPTIWYRNPQGTSGTVMTATVKFQRNFDEVRSAVFTMTATDADNGIAVVPKSVEDLACADVGVLDVWVTLAASSGGPFTSAVSPTIDAITIPYTVGEPFAQ